jgi:hypothetical protein
VLEEERDEIIADDYDPPHVLSTLLPVLVSRQRHLFLALLLVLRVLELIGEGSDESLCGTM